LIHRLSVSPSATDLNRLVSAFFAKTGGQEHNPVSPDRVLKNKILFMIAVKIPGILSSMPDNLSEYPTAYFPWYQEEFPRHASCITTGERRGRQEVLLLPNSGKRSAP
jgi:hypothetical protein